MPNHTLLYIAKRLNERTIILTLPPFAGPSHHVLAPKFNLRYCASEAIKSEFLMGSILDLILEMISTAFTA